jgi:hypothetical protein
MQQCTVCGSDLAQHTKICGVCGNAVKGRRFSSRWILLAAIALIVVLGGTIAFAALSHRSSGVGGGTSSVTGTPPSSQTTGGSATTHLTLTGYISGQMTGFQFQSCGKAGQSYNFNLTGLIGGKQYLLSLNVISYNGPGKYSASQMAVNFHAYPTATQVWADDANVKLPASVTVNSGEGTGSISATLADTSGSTHLPNLQVSGNWVCPGGGS